MNGKLENNVTPARGRARVSGWDTTCVRVRVRVCVCVHTYRAAVRECAYVRASRLTHPELP